MFYASRIKISGKTQRTLKQRTPSPPGLASFDVLEKLTVLYKVFLSAHLSGPRESECEQSCGFMKVVRQPRFFFHIGIVVFTDISLALDLCS